MTERLALLLAASLLSAQCALAEDVGTMTLAPAIQRGLDLRSRYGMALPVGTTMICVDASAAHHTSVELVTVATRDAGGQWMTSTAGEEGPALLAIPQKAIPEERRTLSAADGHALDQLLANPQLYRERSPEQQGPPGIGAPGFVMEIITPQGHLVIGWYGRLLLNAGKVADLIIGKGS